jgi:hypothetical protein
MERKAVFILGSLAIAVMICHLAVLTYGASRSIKARCHTFFGGCPDDPDDPGGGGLTGVTLSGTADSGNGGGCFIKTIGGEK